jgi:hypothetical protein
MERTDVPPLRLLKFQQASPDAEAKALDVFRRLWRLDRESFLAVAALSETLIPKDLQ